MPTDVEKQWMAAWRYAGLELERIRIDRLRRLDEKTGTRYATMLGIPVEIIPHRDSNIGQWATLSLKWRLKSGSVGMR